MSKSFFFYYSFYDGNDIKYAFKNPLAVCWIGRLVLFSFCNPEYSGQTSQTVPHRLIVINRDPDN